MLQSQPHTNFALHPQYWLNRDIMTRIPAGPRFMFVMGRCRFPELRRHDHTA